MMKKVWLILMAMVLVFGLVLLGCGSKKSGTTDPDDPGGPKVVCTVDLTDNFEYGDGYQGLINGIIKKGNNKVADIDKITKDKQYTIRISFIADREIEGDLQVGIADRSPAVSYWKVLTSFDKDGSTDPASIIATKDEINAATEDEPLVKILTFTAIETAGDKDDVRNVLVFQTPGEGVKGAAGSGVKGPFKLIFYDFAFVEGGEDQLPEVGGPGGPTEPELTFDTATDVLKGLAVNEEGFISVDTTTGIISRDEHKGDGDYGNYFSVAIPEDQLPIIASDTIKITYIGKGNAPLTTKTNSSGGDVAPPDYGTFTGNDAVQTKEISAEKYGANIPTSVLWFQGRPNTAAWQLKIISIEVVHGDPIKATTAVGGIRPVATEAPKTSVAENLQYSGTISWSPAVTTAFAESTVYTATISLTAKTGYTFAGIEANSFPVTGASTVTNAAGTTTTLSITAVFPETKGPAPTMNVNFTTANVTGPGVITVETGTSDRPTATVISGVTATEYSVESYAKYDTSYTYFTVTFAAGIVLSDYSKISFTVETISGDNQYKDVHVVAYGAAETPANWLPKGDDKYLIAKQTNNALGGHGNNNIDASLDLGNCLQKDANSIIVAILVPSDNPTIATYKIKNVKFYNP
jgi:hypothetical protein